MFVRGGGMFERRKEKNRDSVWTESKIRQRMTQANFSLQLAARVRCMGYVHRPGNSGIPVTG